jgi:hypothetical protein
MGGRPMQNKRIVVNVVDNEAVFLIAIFGPGGPANIGRRFSLMFPVFSSDISLTRNFEVWLNLDRNRP